MSAIAVLLFLKVRSLFYCLSLKGAIAVLFFVVGKSDRGFTVVFENAISILSFIIENAIAFL
jgi:hypothetical protein